MENIRKKPIVFVSSTCYDLAQIREDLKFFFEESYGFDVMLSEFDSFPVDPCIGTFENCLSNVDNLADIFVLIIGTRYGHVTSSGKSITNLEYLHAKAKGIPIFIFVNKMLYNNLQVWKSNQDGDFSSIVDSTKIFEFVSEIYDESQQWIYTYESVRDITMTMKQQFRFIFSDGLALKKILNTHNPRALSVGDISPSATRMLVEKPFAWEYKFLAYVLKDEFDKLQYHRWNYKYGLTDIYAVSETPSDLLNDISNQIVSLRKLIKNMGILLNTTLPDAIGAPGTESDLDMIVFVAKQFATLYQKVIAWALYFKSLHTDDIFSHLLQLLYELPTLALTKIDNFVDELYREITSLPDVDDGSGCHLKLTCAVDIENADEISTEMQHLSDVLRKQS